MHIASMARRPEFERDDVVRRALKVFWMDGYQGASMSRLGEAMELRPGSIYAAFHSKERLFLEALSAYVAEVQELADGAQPGEPLLRAWFRAHIERSMPGGRGCLLLNAATEAPRMDPETSAAVRTEVERLESLFAACVARARRGATDAGRTSRPNVEATARLLVAALAGISAMSRVGIERSVLEDVAHAALALV